MSRLRCEARGAASASGRFIPKSMLLTRICSTVVMIVEPPGEPSASSATSDAEPAFLEQDCVALEQRGHEFKEVAEIGVATGIAFLDGGRQQSAAEPTRRGGGSAMVVQPDG